MPETPSQRRPSRVPPSAPNWAIVTVMLDRTTGKVELDTTFSTPGETAIMLDHAQDIAAEVMDEANGRNLAE